MREPHFWRIDYKGKTVKTFEEMLNLILVRTGESEIKLLDNPGSVAFVAGYNILELVGYAKGAFSKPQNDVGRISRLQCLLSCDARNTSYDQVTRENLRMIQGYSSYRGIGNLLHISDFRIFF